MQNIIVQNPEHYISKIVRLGENTAYIKYYKTLLRVHISPESCSNTLKNDFLNKFVTKIRNAAELDEDSKLGTYLLVNPNLFKPCYIEKLEFQRVCVTRYRTGSHDLRIEKDRRLPNSNREDRTYICNTGVQTIKHVLLHCPLLDDIRQKYGIVDVENGIANDRYLLEMECILNIK